MTTKPPRSSVTPQPSSQPVAGSAPTNRNRLRIVHRAVSSPTAGCAAHALAAPPSAPPSSATTSVLNISSIFGVDFDPLDQIARHAGAEPAAADHHVHLRGMAGQKHRGLPGGIAAADQHHLLVRAQPRLDRRGPVPDAAAFELRRGSRSRAGDSARRSRPRSARARNALAVVERQREGAVGCGAIERLSPSTGIMISAPNFCAWLKARAGQRHGRRCRSGKPR